MATNAMNTPSHPDPSSSPSPCAARELTGEQRQQLAIHVLAGTEPVTELAGRHQVSRKFLYQQANKGAQALEQTFASKAKDEDVLFYLPVTKAWLRQVVLALVLLCHSSFRGVIAFFRDVLDQPISLGTVHHIVNDAVPVAQQVNAAQDLSRARAGSHDELFQSNQPVLAGIDLDSTYCYLLVPETHRDAETWAIHLWDLAQQGLHPDYTVADGGQGLRAGQALAWPGVPCHGDVFHGLRPLTQLAGTLERRAYAAIVQRDALEHKLLTCPDAELTDDLIDQVAEARLQEVTAIRLADDVRTLAHWMQCDILALAGPEATIRQALYDFVTETLATLAPLDEKRIEPVCRTLVNQRDLLLAFATRLDEALETLAQRFKVPLATVREMLALGAMSSTSPAYWAKATALRRQLRGQFHPLQQALRHLRRRFHRASSLVENFNGRLRNYFFLRRQIGPRYLHLLRFFLNHQPFMRSRHSHRVGKTPARLLTGQEHPHWLEMLGFTRFRRLPQAA